MTLYSTKPSPQTNTPRSAIPTFYYVVFAFYEPALCLTGSLGAFLDPKRTHDGQAPWPFDIPPDGPLPRASLVTLLQLAHVCGLISVLNFFILGAARKHLHLYPALQEKIVSALLTPLMFGDVIHLYVTVWALGEERWELRRYTPMLWTTLILGLSLLVPRVAWRLGIGRYVHKRDGKK